MRMQIALPAVAALALLAAAPASAQIYGGYWGMDQQGGGGAGPYAPECQSFRNYNQRQECTLMVQSGRYVPRGYGYRAHPRYYAAPGYYEGW